MVNEADDPAGSVTLQEAPAFGRLTSALFFASGFAALLYQVAWQRVLFGWYGVDLDSVSAIVSVFMLGLGVGSILGGWIADQFASHRILAFSIIEVTIGLFGWFSLPLIDHVGTWFANSGLPTAVVATFLLLVLPTCAMGATLPVLVTEFVERSKNVGASTGSLYFVNTLGAAAGAYAAAFALLPIGGLDILVTLASATNIAVSIAAFLIFARNR